MLKSACQPIAKCPTNRQRDPNPEVANKHLPAGGGVPAAVADPVAAARVGARLLAVKLPQ
jgi:hypothetical protein